MRIVRAPVLLLGMFFLGLVLTSCNRQQAAATRLVEVTRLVTRSPETGTDGAPATRLVVVTATPPARSGQEPASAFVAEEPTHYRAFSAEEPLTLDPALGQDEGSRALIQNVSEPLLLPDPRGAGRLLPLLATRWISEEEGLSYTFFIRAGVNFSNGNALTAGDVAYTLQRGLLQSAPGGPFSLLMAPFLGYSSGDVTEEIAAGGYAGNREALLANAEDDDLLATCEQVKQAIVADDTAGTVTLTLSRPWAPLPAALSQPWTGIIDQEWASSHGEWDGNCQTWAQWYAPQTGAGGLATQILGTGPYILDHWSPGIEYTLFRNEDYWGQTRSPLGAEGPAGAPPIETVTVYSEPEPRVRWQALRNGNADSADLSPETKLLATLWVGEICSWPGEQCRPGEDEDAPLRHHDGLLLPDRAALFFNFNISSENNPFIGSGQLDGEGIPPNFFSDRRIRQAFAYCFDQESFIESALNGNGRVVSTLIPEYVQAMGGPPPAPPFDLVACAEELAAAWDNLLPETGFRLQIPVEAGNPQQLQVALLLQEMVRAAGDRYNVEIVGLASPLYLEALAAGRLPLAIIPWQAQLPDPHSWAAPAFSADVLSFQRLPSDIQARFRALLDEAVTVQERAERLEVYRALERQRQEFLPHILLPAATGDHYERRWVEGWFYRPTFGEPYYYAYTLTGD